MVICARASHLQSQEEAYKHGTQELKHLHPTEGERKDRKREPCLREETVPEPWQHLEAEARLAV